MISQDRFACRVADRLGLNRDALRRELGIKRPVLAPLNPDAFLAWMWARGDRSIGTSPLTIDDLHFELAHSGWTRRAIWKQYVHLAALVRRNQRLGLDPMDGVW